MTCSKINQCWLKEHSDDSHAKTAQRDGYRSRVNYKLLEIQEKDRILHSGVTVVDLGAVPDGWLQATSRVISDHGRPTASDILEMDSTPDVTFIQGDFTEDAVLTRILEAIDDHPVDLVISGMALNTSGVRAADQPCVTYLCGLVLDLTGRVLQPGGNFLVKILQDEGFDQYRKQVREMFDRVQMHKPPSSCDRSWEQYLSACGFRGEQTGMTNPIACLLVGDSLYRDG